MFLLPQTRNSGTSILSYIIIHAELKLRSSRHHSKAPPRWNHWYLPSSWSCIIGMVRLLKLRAAPQTLLSVVLTLSEVTFFSLLAHWWIIKDLFSNLTGKVLTVFCTAYESAPYFGKNSVPRIFQGDLIQQNSLFLSSWASSLSVWHNKESKSLAGFYPVTLHQVQVNS